MNRNPDGRRALGAVLRQFREACGWSQEALGLEAGVDRTYVGAVERGEQNPSFENVWQLLAALGVSWTEWGRALDAAPALRQRPRTRHAERGIDDGEPAGVARGRPRPVKNGRTRA